MNAVAAAEAENQFRTGMAILTGLTLSPDWQRAVGLIDSAAAAGHPEAIERRALLECRGVGRAPDWEIALNSLAMAAERGSQFAARQLVLLADDQYEPAGSSGPRPGDWMGMRSRIQIARRLQAPAGSGRVLSTSPIVHAVPDFASTAECRWLIAAAAPRLDRAGVYNVPTGIDPGRTNQFAPFNFANADLIVEMIRSRIANQLGAPLGCLEMSQVLHYEVGQEFVLHCDFLDPQAMREEIARNGQRVMTVLIYLNEDFEGGETSFPRLHLDHRGKAGDALIFSSLDAAGRPDPRSQHAGCPPTRGEKWVFSQWVRDRQPNRA
ncbi:MAG TPA: 2OG-Fe(II) oxygenase [Sphingomicrobium sp.]